MSFVSGAVGPQIASSPEGVVTGSPGLTVSSSDGKLWIKLTGTGNTGWSQVAASSTGLGASVTYDPPSLAAGARVSTTVTVAGAVLGDSVTALSFDKDAEGVTLSASVTATNTVTVWFDNKNLIVKDFVSGTLRVGVNQANAGVGSDLASRVTTIETVYNRQAVSVASLRAISSSYTGLITQTGYSTDGDGCTGTWRTVTGSSLVDDSAMVVTPTDASTPGVRRVRVRASDAYDTSHWGCLPGRTGAQNSAALVAAFTAIPVGSTVIYPTAQCRVAARNTGAFSTAIAAYPGAVVGSFLLDSCVAPPMRLDHIRPNLMLDDNQDEFSRIFVTPAASVGTTMLQHKLDGNRLNQPQLKVASKLTMSATFSTSSSNVPVASTTGIVVGMRVLSANVPAGSSVASITNATTFVLGNTGVPIFASTSGTVSTDVGYDTEQSHGVFDTAGWKLFFGDSDNFQGDGYSSYNGCYEALWFRCNSTGSNRNGITISCDTTLAGDNTRPRIIGGSYSARVQPIDFEADNGGTASNLLDPYIDGPTCRPVPTEGAPVGMALSGTTSLVNGTVRNVRLIDSGLYGNYGNWTVEGCEAIIGVQMNATLNSTTAITGLALSGPRNGTPAVGMKVFGKGIPTGVTFTAVNLGAGTATLSAAATFTGAVIIGAIVRVPEVPFSLVRTGTARMARNIVRSCIPNINGFFVVGNAGGEAHQRADMSENEAYFPLDVAQPLFYLTSVDVRADRNVGLAPNMTAASPVMWIRAVAAGHLSAVATDNDLASASTSSQLAIGGLGGTDVWTKLVKAVDNQFRGGTRGIIVDANTFGASCKWEQHGNTFDGVAIPEDQQGITTPWKQIGGSDTQAAIYSGVGTPESVLTAPVGSTATRTDGVGSTTQYTKQTGTGNTGWLPSGPPLQGSATYDPPSIAMYTTVGTARTTTTVTVTGAALGDQADASFSLDTQGIRLTAWVSTANTVTVELFNPTAGAIDLASGTLRVKVVAA